MHQVRELQREKSAAAEATALKSLDLEKKTLDFEKSARELDKKARELDKKTLEAERKAQEIERLQKEITKLHDELFAEKSRVAETEKARMALDSRLRDAERSSNDLERYKKRREREEYLFDSRRGNSLLQEIEKTRDGQSGVSHDLHEAQASIERLLKDNLELEKKLFEKEQSLKDANSKLV
jgi:predicted  nucleic acid-binding Zn-ribbon protein